MAVNKNISVYDNYVNPPEFALLQKKLMGIDFDWYYCDQIVREGGNKDHNFQFIHMFYDLLGTRSKELNYVVPVINQLDPIAIHRIKANCLPWTENIKVSGLHTDINEKRMLESTPMTAILYINTNDGYTLFEDGTKIDSVANRICIFPYYLKHSGTTCTNANRRIALNINYVR